MQRYDIKPVALQKYSEEVDVPEVEGLDKECYCKTFGFVMEMSIKKTKEMCEKTKCPVMTKWCKWAGESEHNKEMAYGMIMGKVEPWKF